MPRKTQVFPKTEKILHNDDFQKLFAKGRWIHTQSLSLLLLENNCSYNRIGISAPKKIYKKSTQRNRIKRLMREAYRLNRADFKKTGYDIVLIAKKVDLDSKYSDAETLFKRIFKKAGLL